MIQTGPAAIWAVLLWAAVGGIYKDVVMCALACSTSWGGEAQVLAVAIVFCALVGTFEKKGMSKCKSPGIYHLTFGRPSKKKKQPGEKLQCAVLTYQSDWTC